MAVKLCKDCRHCEIVTLGGLDFSKCRRPVGLDVVTGKVATPQWQYCSTQRDGGWIMAVVAGVCGERGRFYSAR